VGKENDAVDMMTTTVDFDVNVSGSPTFSFTSQAAAVCKNKKLDVASMCTQTSLRGPLPGYSFPSSASATLANSTSFSYPLPQPPLGCTLAVLINLTPSFPFPLLQQLVSVLTQQMKKGGRKRKRCKVHSCDKPKCPGGYDCQNCWANKTSLDTTRLEKWKVSKMFTSRCQDLSCPDPESCPGNNNQTKCLGHKSQVQTLDAYVWSMNSASQIHWALLRTQHAFLPKKAWLLVVMALALPG